MSTANEIPSTLTHDAGAFARCSYCARYSDDPRTLVQGRECPVCECGSNTGWSGSFPKPLANAAWSKSIQPLPFNVVNFGECVSCTNHSHRNHKQYISELRDALKKSDTLLLRVYSGDEVSNEEYAESFNRADELGCGSKEF